MNREEGQGEGNLETYDSNQETTEYTQIGTLEIETEHVLSRFSWGEPISAHCTELFLNIQGFDTPFMLQFKEEMILGRKGTGETGPFVFDLTPFGGDEKGVSRNHAALRQLKHNLFLVDLGSSNGTFVNGQRLISHQPYMLVEGDEIRLGNLVATVSYRPETAQAG